MSALNLKPENLAAIAVVIGGTWWLMNHRSAFAATTRTGAPVGRSPLAPSAGVRGQNSVFYTSPADAGPNLVTRVGWALTDSSLWSQIGKIAGTTSPAQQSAYQAANAANAGVGASTAYSGSPSDEQIVPLGDDGNVFNPPGNLSVYDTWGGDLGGFFGGTGGIDD